MLTIVRTQPQGHSVSKDLDATILYRRSGKAVDGCPDLSFAIRTYSSISKYDPRLTVQPGDQILLPINLFFETLTDDEQQQVYGLYNYAAQTMRGLTVESRQSIQLLIQKHVDTLITNLNLCERVIAFASTPIFPYPNLTDAGQKSHHTKDKTFFQQDYVEVTAISVLVKMMIPIWGEYIQILDQLHINPRHRLGFAFEMIEPSLETGVFEHIYGRISRQLEANVQGTKKSTNAKSSASNTAFVLTHSGFDDDAFNEMIMAALIVKRLAPYPCLDLTKDGVPPDVAVYIYTSTSKATSAEIKNMRDKTLTLPHHELSDRSGDDNSSIIDHSSRTSRKPADGPVIVQTAVQLYMIPRMVEETGTDVALWKEACHYYLSNSFDFSPLTQALVASFVGTRFGGSKCLNYLSAPVYQQLVALVQIFLLKRHWTDLATLASAKTLTTPVDGTNVPLAILIRNDAFNSPEYKKGLVHFKGFLMKPVFQFNKKKQRNEQTDEKIDFHHHIARMVDWLIHYPHQENMAPCLWTELGGGRIPVAGSDVAFDQNVIRNLCNYYLLFHSDQKPF